MIDNPAHALRLLAKVRAALPLAATATPDLMATLPPDRPAPKDCTVTEASYAGDEAGIVCRFSIEPGGAAAHVSITLLRFDPRHTLTREIALYQKRRSKRIRRQGGAVED